MNNVTKIVSTAVAAIILTTTFAQAGGNVVVQLDRTKLQLAKVASCLVAGSPSEFPDDIWFTNKGAGVLKAGTKIKWDLVGYGTKGTYTLVADLSPGKDVHAINVIPGGVEAGHDCKAKVQ